MSKIESIQRWLGPVAGAGAFAVGLFLRDALEAKQVPYSIAMSLVVFCVFLIVRLSQDLFLYALGESRRLRQLIFGSQFFEGRWVEACIDPEREVFLSFVDVLVSFEQGALIVSGDVYRPDGTKEAYFESKQTSVQGRNLYYQYERTSTVSPEGTIGSGRIKFAASEKAPDGYGGGFHDPGTLTYIKIDGRRRSGPVASAFEGLVGRAFADRAREFFADEYPTFRFSDSVAGVGVYGETRDKTSQHEGPLSG